MRKGRILDVGCAFGLFLDVARSRGWDVNGVEISEYAADYARKELKIKVITKPLEKAKFPEDYFDVIHMAELIEHLPDPKKTLMECNRVLKRNGLIVIQTSDIDSLYARIMGKHWDWFLPGHLYYFSRKTLRGITKKTGFKIIKEFYGDEIGISLKAIAYWKDSHSVINFLKMLAIQLPRYIHFGNLAIGGVVMYAKKC